MVYWEEEEEEEEEDRGGGQLTRARPAGCEPSPHQHAEQQGNPLLAFSVTNYSGSNLPAQSGACVSIQSSLWEPGAHKDH